MATLFEDTFDSYTDGNLNGKGSWLGDPFGDFTVQSVVVFQGAKAIENTDSDSVGQEVYKSTVVPVNDGRITIYLRKNSITSGELTIQLSEVVSEVVTPRVKFRLERDTNLAQYRIDDIGQGDNGWFTMGTYSVNTWHCIETEWRSSDHYARYRIDKGTWTDWSTVFSNWVTGLQTLQAVWWNDTAGTKGYFDYIAEEPFPIPTPGNPIMFGTNI